MIPQKNILVLTASPRKNGNSFAMAKAFIEAAEKKGHKITRFDTAYMRIAGCRGCRTCFQTGKACSFDDDFNRLAPAVEAADAVVLVSPLYWFTFPAQIKAAIDKLYAFKVADRDIAGKECALIACCADTEPFVYDSMRLAYGMIIDLLGWNSLAELYVKGVNAPGEIEKTDGLTKAAALAELF